VRAWGRLGYPRRALRLVEAARSIVDEHDGVVPDDYQALHALPGVGDYTAAAVASFAFGRRHVVLDTNVRRVLARCLGGEALPPASASRAERERAETVLPEDPATAARWAVAVMEIGALVCTASNPRCPVCPLQDSCRWHLDGRPAHAGPARRVQTYAGTDRQCRGRLLEVLRTDDDPVPASRLDAVWHDEVQRARCLASLIDDGLVVRTLNGAYALPGYC
jgi:A/G-specific adenine glycosylase